MANVFSSNLTPSNYTECMYQFMRTLSLAGWSIMAWSDGITARNTGTIPGPYAAGPGSPDPVYPLTGAFPNGAAAGANGLSNSRAWFVMRQPKTPASASFTPVYGGTRMIVVQRSTSGDTDWRIKYSTQGGYQFASGPTVTPSLYGLLANQDDVTMWGGGTDASPTFTILFGDTSTGNGVSRCNIMANNGASSETAPFGIWMTTFRNGGGVTPGMSFVLDPMAPGTIGVGEADPYVFYIDGNGVNNSGQFNMCGNDYRCGLTSQNITPGVFSWLKYGLTGQAFVRIPTCLYVQTLNSSATRLVAPASNNTFIVAGAAGTNPYNNNDDLFPLVYVRSANQGSLTGYKGVSSLLKWNSVLRSVGDTQAQNTVRDRIIMGDVSLPWDGSIPAI